MMLQAPHDFALSLHGSEKNGVIFMITKKNLSFIMFDVPVATMVVRTNVSQDALTFSF